MPVGCKSAPNVLCLGLRGVLIGPERAPRFQKKGFKEDLMRVAAGRGEGQNCSGMGSAVSAYFSGEGPNSCCHGSGTHPDWSGSGPAMFQNCSGEGPNACCRESVRHPFLIWTRPRHV